MALRHYLPCVELSWWAWPYWLLAGTALGLGIVSLLTIGIPLLLIGMLMALVGTLERRLRNRSAGMALLGAAAAPGLLAWNNRDGPGTVCRALDGMTTCSQRYAPWPFMAVAAALVAAGCLAVFRRPRARRV